MPLTIISAEHRSAETRGVKALVVGPTGVGKTSLLRTLDLANTLFIDVEGGDLSVQDVPVDAQRPTIWCECRDLAVYARGPDPTAQTDAPYGQRHFERVCEAMGGRSARERYSTYFIDSLTNVSRHCFTWALQQPEAFSERTGKPDARGAYGLLARELINWLIQLQHARAKNVILIGILEQIYDEFNRTVWQLQIEGSKTGRELPGIVDQVITMQFVRFEDGGDPVRCLVCHQPNPFGYPAKDRSGRLGLYEKPHLGELIAKITTPRVV